MKKQELNEGLNHIPMDLVENFTATHDKLVQKAKGRKLVSRIAAMAACICILVSATLIAFPMISESLKSGSNTNEENSEVNKSSDDPSDMPPPEGSEGTGGTDSTDGSDDVGDQENDIKTMHMTVAQTRPSCMAIDKNHPDYGSCFFAYGEDDRFYCVPWNEVDNLSVKSYIRITYTDIQSIEYPGEKNDGGYAPDYLMIATKVETVCNESMDYDYGKLISFSTAVVEHEAKDYNSVTNIEVPLFDYDMNYLSIRCSDLSTWTDDSAVDREPFVFTGRIRVATGDTVDWLYYGYYITPQSSITLEGTTLYYHGYFTNMNEKDANLFNRIVPTHPEVEIDTDWIAFSSSEVSSKILRLNENDEQSILTIMHGDAAWIYEIPECDWIGIFTGPDIHIRYFDCGTIADLSNDRSRKLTDEEKAIIEPLIKRYNLAGNYNKFSYSGELAKYPQGTPGVKYDGFNNTAEQPIYTDTDALELAKNECTVTWDAGKVYYDVTADVWKVLFYTNKHPGGDQSVYLSAEGKTLLIVYGE